MRARAIGSGNKTQSRESGPCAFRGVSCGSWVCMIGASVYALGVESLGGWGAVHLPCPFTAPGHHRDGPRKGGGAQSLSLSLRNKRTSRHQKPRFFFCFSGATSTSDRSTLGEWFRGQGMGVGCGAGWGPWGWIM